MSALRRLGALLFRARGWTAVPLAAALLVVARPTWALALPGLALVAAGEALRVAALRHLPPTARGLRLHAERLAVTGPFAVVRHPIYAGNALLVAGACAAAGATAPWFLALVAAAFVVQYGAIVAAEEAFLERRFPEEFARYRTLVPLAIPRPAAVVTNGNLGRSPTGRSARSVRDDRAIRPLASVLRAEFRTLQTISILLALVGLKGLVAGR